MEALEAYQLAAQLHTGQVDKAGRPYIEHLTRVFLRVHRSQGQVLPFAPTPHKLPFNQTRRSF